MDLGTPLIVGNRAVGIMTATVKGETHLAVFTSILEHREEIQRLKGITRLSTYIHAPRIFARYDWETYHHPVPLGPVQIEDHV